MSIPNQVTMKPSTQDAQNTFHTVNPAGFAFGVTWGGYVVGLFVEGQAATDYVAYLTAKNILGAQVREVASVS